MLRATFALTPTTQAVAALVSAAIALGIRRPVIQATDQTHTARRICRHGASGVLRCSPDTVHGTESSGDHRNLGTVHPRIRVPYARRWLWPWTTGVRPVAE